MLSLFFFLLLVAVVLGIIGFVVNGLLYLLVIGVIIFLLSLVFAGWRLRRNRPSR